MELISACKSGNEGIVKVLLSNPWINVNEKSLFRYTSLMHASANGHLEIVKLLIQELMSMRDLLLELQV